jgi:hypothetical protein
MKRFTGNRHARPGRATHLLQGVVTIMFGAAVPLAYAQSPSAPGATTGVMVYPAKGQSVQQQDKDKYQCYDWARGQTGVDPAQTAQAASATTPTQSRGQAGAMVKGAASGAAVARIANGEAGRGAAAGAMGAAMREQAQEQQLAQARQQQAGQQQAARNQQRAAYDRAFAACMEGRGYTVR